MYLDYAGNMDYYQRQLTAKGISVTELNMNDYVGLTAHELQSIVNNADLYRHKPTQPAKVLYKTYLTAFAHFSSVLTKYGFSVSFTLKDFEEQIPNWFNILDTYTGHTIELQFEATYGSVEDAQQGFLRDLKWYLDTCCSDEHKVNHKKTSSELKYWHCKKYGACQFCRYRIASSTYNRLKGMFYELIKGDLSL